MNKAYHRDLRRTVAAHKKRFFSLAAITALGVAMFAGLQASCRCRLSVYFGRLCRCRSPG